MRVRVSKGCGKSEEKDVSVEGVLEVAAEYGGKRVREGVLRDKEIRG